MESMNFQNFDQSQGMPGAQDQNVQGGGNPQQQQQGQPIQSAEGQFQQGGQMGAPGSAGGDGQPGENKTTLWYVILRAYIERTATYATSEMANALTVGWANWSHGLTRTLFAASGSAWASRST